MLLCCYYVIMSACSHCKNNDIISFLQYVVMFMSPCRGCELYSTMIVIILWHATQQLYQSINSPVELIYKHSTTQILSVQHRTSKKLTLAHLCPCAAIDYVEKDTGQVYSTKRFHWSSCTRQRSNCHALRKITWINHLYSHTSLKVLHLRVCKG